MCLDTHMKLALYKYAIIIIINEYLPCGTDQPDHKWVQRPLLLTMINLESSMDK